MTMMRSAQGAETYHAKPSSSSVSIPTIDKHTPLCETYDGHTPVVHDRKRDFLPLLEHDPDYISEDAYLSLNNGLRSSITATIVGGYIQLQVDKSAEAERIPWRVMVNLGYNPGVQNIGQNGWWIKTGVSNTCHYWIGHSVGAIDSVNLRWQH